MKKLTKKGKMLGEKNSMFGHRHTEETIPGCTFSIEHKRKLRKAALNREELKRQKS